MTTTAEPYDWGLEEPQIETPADQIWTLLAEYDRAAQQEDLARQKLMGYLASLNADVPPVVGDLVTPWALLRMGDSPRFPIIDILKGEPGAEPGYVVRLSKLGEKPELSIYGPGAFFVAARGVTQGGTQ